MCVFECIVQCAALTSVYVPASVLWGSEADNGGQRQSYVALSPM